MTIRIKMKTSGSTAIYEDIESVDKDDTVFKMKRIDGAIIGVMLNAMEYYIVEPNTEGE